jgi:hypothetical protein
MLKTVITPNESIYLLPIPANYIGKPLEVILYSCDEMSERKVSNDKRPSDFFGTLNAVEGEEFMTYVTNSRLEWNRNI